MSKSKPTKAEGLRPKILEINLETGQAIERDATDAELAQMLLDAEETAAREAEVIAAQIAKQDARARLVTGKATFEDLELLGL